MDRRPESEGDAVINTKRLVRVRDSEINAIKGVGTKPTSAWVDRSNGWIVQVFEDTAGCNGTPWEGTKRVSVKHTKAKNPRQFSKRSFSAPITWDDLQAIKDHLWPSRIAIEVYPPDDQIVDACDMRSIWVLPAGACLPVNLSGDSDVIQST